jgi:outer membrane usher protein
MAGFVAVMPAAAFATQAPADAALTLDPDAAAPKGSLNPTGRAVILTVPVMDGTLYLGDVSLTIGADESVQLPAARLLDLVGPRVTDEVREALRALLAGRGALASADLAQRGIQARYNPQSLQVELTISSASRASRALHLAESYEPGRGGFVAPANYSAYVNLRGSFDYVHQGDDRGLTIPVIYVEGAARYADVVLETEGNWQPGVRGTDYQRRGTRLVLDDANRLVRWAAGDLLTLGRGFQSAPDMAGISLYRSYNILQPQTIIRPRGDRSFRLDRRSTVEVRVNDQLIRRMELDPGAYDLRDFPFAQGANDVRLTITDDAGRTETVRFNIFLDQAQLASGLSEFGVYAGILSPLGRGGPVYSDDLAVSGFYRRGISDRLTLGANVQAEPSGFMGGGEIVAATAIGSVAAFASGSYHKDFGSGWASIVTFQRPFQRSNGQSDTLSFSLEARSRNFAPIDAGTPFNPFVYEVGAGYSRTLAENIYAGVDARFSKGRDDQADVTSIRANVGWSISPDLTFTGDARYERDTFGRHIGAFLSLTYRLNRYSNLRGDYDTRFNRARITYQTYRGSGTGSYNINADLERSDGGVGATVNANYFTNRAELGFSHFGTFEGEFGPSTSQRSSIRFGTAIGMADGTFSVGRPVYDSFAVVRAHRSLKGADVILDPAGAGYGSTANTGRLGTALYPSLSSYSERNIVVDAPLAPPGADLGAGAFRLMPPYRAGYLLTVGSDYAVTIVGRLLNAAGEPVKLVAGTATELARPERNPVTLFTNADGRFSAAALAPGKWRIVMLDTDKSAFEIDIPKENEGIVRLGDLKAVPSN